MNWGTATNATVLIARIGDFSSCNVKYEAHPQLLGFASSQQKKDDSAIDQLGWWALDNDI